MLHNTDNINSVYANHCGLARQISEYHYRFLTDRPRPLLYTGAVYSMPQILLGGF